MTIRLGLSSRAEDSDRGTSLSPGNLTFRMPAEWEPHEATWLSWPHELTDWPGKFSPIPWAFAEIVRHLTQAERVFLIVEDRTAEVRARAVLEKAGAIVEAVSFFHIPTDRGWMRDSGPIGVFAAPQGQASGAQATRDVLLNFAFNGWAKYDDYKKDARVVALANRRLRRNLVLPEHKNRRVVLEGGAIDVNGCGTMLTTEECLLSDVQSRNPGYTKYDYAQVFKKYFGVTNILWLRKGIAGDDTHGHIDDLARFVDAKTVVTVVEEDRAEANYEPLQENLALLREMKDQHGQPLRVETLPMPRPVYFAGQCLPASYANFYIANTMVLVPTFNDSADRLALNTLASLFPDREIVPIYGRDLVLGLGTIHCMTQQLPRL
jgi:agmatine deiminase